MKDPLFNNFPDVIHYLSDDESVLSLPSVSYIPELHTKKKLA